MRKVKFESLPLEIQDQLRDAPITEIKKQKVIVETYAKYQGRLHFFQLELQPTSLRDEAVVCATQDLEGEEVLIIPVIQELSA